MNYPPAPNSPFPIAAFLLAGGASSRMGRDKALLPFRNKPLVVYLAEMLSKISSEFYIVAPPGRYEKYGYSIVSDRRKEAGPLAGIEAALEVSRHEWNLILACDLARMDPDWLSLLCTSALIPNAFDCIASGATPQQPNPLCAVWRNSALPKVKSSLDNGIFRVRSVLETLNSQILIPPDPGILANWNSPADLPADLDEGKANRGG